MNELSVDVNPLIDCLECIQDANDNQYVKDTIDEVIDVVYTLAKIKLMKEVIDEC